MGLLSNIGVKQIGLVVVLLLGLYIGATTFLGGNEGGAEPEYSLEYSENQVQVSQTQGPPIGEVSVNVEYLDGSSQSQNVSFTEGNLNSTVNLDKSLFSVVSTQVTVNGTVVLEPEVPEEFSPDAPEIQEIEDREIEVGDTLQVSADQFTSSDVDIAQYEWNLDDGTQNQEETVVHTYDSPGTYEVTLGVIDIAGNTANAEFNVTVEEGTRTQNLIQGDLGEQLPDSLETGESFQLDGTNISSQEVTGYEWSMGDGTTYDQSSSTHQYDSSGLYNVTLQVEGASGGTDSVSSNIEVNSVQTAPEITDVNAEFEGQDLEVGENVTFTSTLASGDADNLTYSWVFGDSQTSSSASPTHTYESGGDYVVELTVTDESSGSSDTFTNSPITVVENTVVEDQAVTADVDANGISAYTFDNVQPSEQENILLSGDSPGDDNPTLHMQVGETYRFNLGDTSQQHPFEIRDSNGDALLSMDDEGEFESDEEVDWSEENGTIEFTATSELVERSDTYICTVHQSSMNGDIVKFQDDDNNDDNNNDDGNNTDDDDNQQATDREANVTIEMDNNGLQSWRVADVTGESSYGEVVRDDSRGDSNPTIYLQQGFRYEFTGIPNDPFDADVSMEFIDIVGDTLLSQTSEGSFQNDPGVSWVDEGSTVRFTVTSDISGEIERYVAPEQDSDMNGKIVVE